MIGFNVPFRYLKNEGWLKSSDGLELCAPQSGAMFRFTSANDLSLFTTGYAPIRILIVVKDSSGERFTEKLLLLSSMNRVLIATSLNKPFDRTSAENTRSATLILAASAANLNVSVHIFPKGHAPTVEYDLQYNEAEATFNIPDNFKITSVRNNAVAIRTPLTRGIQMRRSQAACFTCQGSHQSEQCRQRSLERCPECHVPVRCVDEHALNCSLKNWFLSQYIDDYVKVPVVRCIISMASAIFYQLGESIEMARGGLVLYSPMSDTLFKFASESKFELLTTAFTRIRLPFVVREGLDESTCTEKLVLITSHDRTLVAANASRQILQGEHDGDCEHNTPLVLYVVGGQNLNLSVKVIGVQNRSKEYQIVYNQITKKYNIPAQLNVKSTEVLPLEFDAPFLKKKKAN